METVTVIALELQVCLLHTFGGLTFFPWFELILYCLVLGDWRGKGRRGRVGKEGRKSVNPIGQCSDNVRVLCSHIQFGG